MSESFSFCRKKIESNFPFESMSTPLFYLFNDQVLVTKEGISFKENLEKNGLGRTGRGGDVHLE